MKPHKVEDYEGWEIFEAAPGSFSIRRSGQRIGPYDSLEQARRALDAEDSRSVSQLKPD